MLVEAEKSYQLPSASWRPREAGGRVPVQSQRPENRGPHGASPSLSLEVQEPEGMMSEDRSRWMSQLKERAN